MTADQVLRAFHHDAPYLFLGAAFVAVGVVSAAFAVIRRKHDLLLIYFALFAVFYGLRLWVQATLLGITIQGSAFYVRLRSAIDYIILIPAFLFFSSLGLPTQIDRVVAYTGVVVGALLTLATFILGPSAAYSVINSVVVIAAMVFLFFSKFMRASGAETDEASEADFAAIRWGLLIFVVVVLWDNIKGLLSISSPRIEPFGFVAFLSSLGYVAARRTLQRDQQLNEIQKELDVARRIQLSILPAEFPS